MLLNRLPDGSSVNGLWVGSERTRCVCLMQDLYRVTWISCDITGSDGGCCEVASCTLRTKSNKLSSGDISVMSANRKPAATTGSARKIKDNAADWHNLMLRWDKLNEDGFMVAASITNMKRAPSDQLLLYYSSSPPPSSSPQHVGRASELQDKCLKLQEIIDKMAAVVMKMDRLMTSQRGVEDLEVFQFGAEGRKTPLFHSWSTREFGEISQVLLDSFRQELLMKQTILQEVAHTVTSDLCMVFLSCWLHQPFIPTQSRLRLEALLLETGHRPL